MRYTTIIDITEQPAVYRNINCRLLYLHLALRSGYHDADRDMIDISIRRLAMETGLTVSATRHALRVLETAQLLSKVGPLWHVKKWLLEDQISPRAKKQKQQADDIRATAARQEREEQERRRQQEIDNRRILEQTGKTEFMVYYEDLMKRAEAGDVDAARLVQQRRSIYEAHKRDLEQHQP